MTPNRIFRSRSNTQFAQQQHAEHGTRALASQPEGGLEVGHRLGQPPFRQRDDPAVLVLRAARLELLEEIRLGGHVVGPGQALGLGECGDVVLPAAIPLAS